MILKSNESAGPVNKSSLTSPVLLVMAVAINSPVMQIWLVTCDNFDSCRPAKLLIRLLFQFAEEISFSREIRC